MVVLVPARVLVGPLDRQRRPCVVVETAHVVPSTIVVLGIIQPGRKQFINKFQCHDVIGHGGNDPRQNNQRFKHTTIIIGLPVRVIPIPPGFI